MSHDLVLLLATAGSLGIVHTLLGPDHYLPFIAMAQARDWSTRKTATITVLCGVGHVTGSIALGALGIVAGVALHALELTESIRGDIAAWLLTAFGLAYCVWGLRRAIRSRPHTHRHAHGDAEHVHEHHHHGGHVHVHDERGSPSLTPWILFTIFVFGPCEPLIPLLLYPAAAQSPFAVVLVAGVFGAATVGTMVGVVLLAGSGLRQLPVAPFARYGHALAGAVILLCGVAIHAGL